MDPTVIPGRVRAGEPRKEDSFVVVVLADREAPLGAARLQELVQAGLHPAVKRAGLATEESKSSGATKKASSKSEGRSSGIPPYDLRHAYASLQIRAGLSIPELAEQMGHSPQMTLATYAHVIRELKGLPRVSAEEQIERAREARGREVDVQAGG